MPEPAAQWRRCTRRTVRPPRRPSPKQQRLQAAVEHIEHGLEYIGQLADRPLQFAQESACLANAQQPGTFPAQRCLVTFEQAREALRGKALREQRINRPVERRRSGVGPRLGQVPPFHAGVECLRSEQPAVPLDGFQQFHHRQLCLCHARLHQEIPAHALDRHQTSGSEPIAGGFQAFTQTFGRRLQRP